MQKQKTTFSCIIGFLQKKSKNDSRWDPQRRTKSDKTKKGEAFSNEAEKSAEKSSHFDFRKGGRRHRGAYCGNLVKRYILRKAKPNTR